MSVLGIDVSTRILDWRPLRDAGGGFAFTRLGTEPGTIDAAGVLNLAGARAAGIIPGAYEFLTGPFTKPGGVRVTPADRAKRFSDALGDPAGVLVALDVETPSYPEIHPAPTAADVDAWMNAWCALHPGHAVWQYGSVPGPAARSTAANHGPLWRCQPWLAAKGKTLAAGYAAIGGDACPSWNVGAAGWQRASILQFTFYPLPWANVTTLRSSADADVFRGTIDELRALAAFPVAPAPAPQYRAVANGVRIRMGAGINYAETGNYIAAGALVRGRIRTGGWYSALGVMHNDWLALESINGRGAGGRFAAAAFFRAV